MLEKVVAEGEADDRLCFGVILLPLCKLRSVFRLIGVEDVLNELAITQDEFDLLLPHVEVGIDELVDFEVALAFHPGTAS